MDDRFTVEELDGGAAPSLVAGQEMDLALGGDARVAGVPGHLGDRAVIVELVLDPLQGPESGAPVGRPVAVLIEPHQLDGEAGLVHAAAGELPAELVEGHAAVP